MQFELTALLQANQVHVEHRYFLPSRPDPVSWPFLNIAQSAADHHAIVTAFRPLYTAKWVSSGASKGGMASVYHRFYYPDDVDATVAYVAPSSHGTQDPRYVAFVASLGSTKCRNRLLKFQRRALKKREKLVRFMDDPSYDILGKDQAIEFRNSRNAVCFLAVRRRRPVQRDSWRGRVGAADLQLPRPRRLREQLQRRR
ncbi:MAG: hypothetical protein IPF82_15770 [Blastocatellia bacterium]|nr:hypothetical protein [Blastocatellia bacterium]